MISFENQDSQTSFEQIPESVKPKFQNRIILIVWLLLIIFLVGFYFFQNNELQKDFGATPPGNSIGTIQTEAQNINIPDFSQNY